MNQNFALQFLVTVLMSILVAPSAIYAQTADTHIRNATGGLQIAYVNDNGTTVLYNGENDVKALLDQGWEPIAELMAELDGEFPKLHEDWDIAVGSHVAPTTMTKLQITQLSDGLALTYIAHENSIGIVAVTPSRWLNSSVTIHFDIELTFHLEVAADGRTLRITHPKLQLRRQAVVARGVFGAILTAALEPLLEEGSAQLAELSAEPLRMVGQTLNKVTIGDLAIPAGLHLVLSVQEPDGDLLLCFSGSSVHSCTFRENQ
ncbi:MAG: hypothetical protein R2932_41355 [Caldilineaceae bacterium]